MREIDVRDQIKIKLDAGRFTGLYASGECACHAKDIAPCGEVGRKQGEEYINGCKPGHLHRDPLNPANWIVQASTEAPSSEEWDALRGRYGFSVL